MADQKLMLIDGNSLLYRAFYALPLLHTGEGIYTNGVYGFLTMYYRVVAEQKPTHIVVAFDKSRQTFRSDIYNDYKANRSAPPDELSGQFQLLRDTLGALNVDYIELDGYEADDLIGTLSKQADEAGLETVILTGDGDSLQLVSDRVKVLMTRKGISEMDLYGPDQVQQKWEVEPAKMIEIKALMGDASDNIPGVPGIGPKTAIKLIKEFGTLDNLYANLEQAGNPRMVEKLVTYRDQAFKSRELATIIRDLNLNCCLEDFQVKEPHREQLIELYRRLEFKTFLKSLQESGTTGREIDAGEVAVQELGSQAEVEEFLQAIAPAGVAIYLEADYHHPMWSKLTALYFEHEERVYRLQVTEKDRLALEWVRPLLETPDTPKYMHNAKFAQVLLWRYGITLRGVKGDTLLAAYVDDPAFEGDALKTILFKYLNINVAGEDSAGLASLLRKLCAALEEKLSAEQKKLLEEVELPLSNVLAAMEYTGVRVDRATLQAISEELAGGISRDESRIFELAGTSFNINSPKQLGEVLFEKLGLRVIKKTKTGYATGAEILEALYEDHPIIPYILDYRQLTKLKSTYADALQGLIHPETGRVHTIFKQAQTATGRLSSVEPNLQNIPIKMEEGRRIRKAFSTADETRVLMSADYSQIDLRSLAHISGDETLIETFHQGIDIHTRTAAEIFKVPLQEVTPDLRRRAKAVNFGIIYGISDFGLARDTGVSRSEARRYIEQYLDSYPGVRKYMDEIVEFGKKHGYVETVLKRRRYLPDLNARNKMVQSFARRMAYNTPIQGTSADIIKLAMIRVARELEEKCLEARLLLQVHDDLVLEVPRDEVERVADLLEDCMVNAYPLRVPLEVSVEIGPNWYDMHPLDRD